jgi:hypothetical protein
VNARSVVASVRRVLGPVGRFVRTGSWVIFWVVRAAVRRVSAHARRFASAETRPQWMNRLPGNRFALAALVVLGLVALYGVAAFDRPAASVAPRGVTVPVPAATAACPDPTGARVTAVTPPGSHAAGQAQVTGTQAVPAAPGTAWSTDVKKSTGLWTVAASGSLASGLTVEQTTSEGGLAGTRCAQPATDLWFAGPGPADADDVGLYLSNVDGRPVSVVIAGLGVDGSLETPQGQDEISVAPYSTRLVQVGVQVEGLGEAAAGEKLIALHVRATSGRIAAAVRVQRTKGVDWLPATTPANSVVVPGVPSGGGRRRLLVAVPGRDEASVTVQVVTPDGTFAAGDRRTLQAAALAVTPYDLGLGGKPAAVRLVSNRPIVAALIADVGDDFAATAATPPLLAPRPAPGGRAADAGQGGLVADDRDTTRLLLSAPGPGAVVRLTQIMSQGPTGTAQDVTVPGGRTIEVTMPPPAGGDRYGLFVVPRPGSGPVYAARLLEIKKQGVSLMPVVPARTTVVLPAVVEAPVP